MFHSPVRYSATKSSKEAPENRSETVNRLDPPKQDSEEADLLSKMPTLFDPKLPPVGPERQVAYERLVKILRERWIFSQGTRSAVDLTRELHDELADEAKRSYLWNSHRVPWRREEVFQFEMQWSEWFLREATIEETGEWVDVQGERPEEKPVLRITNFAYNDSNGFDRHDDDDYDAWSYGGGE